MARISKKKKAAAGVAALALIGGGVAWAYWTSSGSGTGSAELDTLVPLVVHDVDTVADLAPGGTSSVGDFYVDNPNDSAVQIETVEGTVTGISGAQDNAGCDLSWFTVNITTQGGPPASLAANTTNWHGEYTVTMVNEPYVNQDACQGGTLDVHLSINGG